MANPLSFPMQPTDLNHNQWCWAAVAASVADFKERTAHKQCDVASSLLGIPDCCDGGDCNVPAQLDDALAAVHHLNHASSGTTEFNDVRQEINGDRPLGVRIAWSGGGVGHFVVISGYDDTKQWVTVDDPLHGHSSMPYTEFCKSYKNIGSWTDSYFTV